jgi:hypothetical protein
LLSLSFAITSLLARQQGIIHSQVYRRHRDVGQWPGRTLQRQPLCHGVSVYRPAVVEQTEQRRLHGRLALVCSQVQDAQVLLGRPGRLPLEQQVVGHAEAAAGEQVGTVAVVSERSRLAHQGVDDVSVVDLVLATSPQTGQLGHLLVGIPELQPLGMQAGLEPLTNEPAGHRVDVTLHPHRAACLHTHTQPLARFQPTGRQRSQQGQFLGQSSLPTSVEPVEELAQEGRVSVAAREVAAAAEHQGLVERSLELAMTLFDVAILVALAGLYRLGRQAVVIQQSLVAALERLWPSCRLHGSGEPVGAVQLRHTSQLPQGVLQAFAEALVALGEADRAGFPVGVGQDEVVDQVGKGAASQGNGQVGAVGEVTGGQASGVMDLGEENLLGWPVLGAPLLEAPLQGAQLAVSEATGMLALQLLKERLGLEPGVESQLLLQPGPDAIEGVGACPPGAHHAYLAGQPLELPIFACGLAVDACLGSGQRQRHTFVQGLAQAQNLLVRDHRGLLSGQGVLMVSARSHPGEF